ncbi:AAA family ATPase [Pelagerythrobacter marinus]|uniref:AAA family ATPase n=1 Tax=Pelagerythrobacter marinus TaxID=538382 RepID=UPI002AC93D56|nr:AAA family ATPase [Pelagerythrobacter marinus]WPZ07595.1 AAA family ATPase [Pelagerythrobacter marinus]
MSLPQPANPYLDVLPPLATMNELARQIGSRPHHSDAERTLRHVERRYCVLRLRQLFIPAARHVRFGEGIDMLLRSGYEGRDPSRGQFIRRQAALAKRGKKDLLLPARPLGCDSGAGSGFLIGAPGMGKTRTIEQMLKRYPQAADLPNLPRQVVWIKLECPERGSIRSLCLQFFDELTRLAGSTDYGALLAPRRASDDDLMNRMALAAAWHGVGILVIDEIQHIGRHTGEEHQLMTFLTRLTNQLAIPVLLAGTLSVLGQVQKTGRMARRSVGPACAVWMPRPQDREWRSLLEQLWRFQWTQTATELDEELAETFFECTGGILDLLVKLYVSVQLRLIYRSEVGGGRDEVITPAFVRGVAEADFAPVRPMIEALCLGDSSSLRRFDDLHAFDRSYWGALEQLMEHKMQQPIDTGGAVSPKIAVREGDHYQLIWSKLQTEGLGDDLILQLIDKVRAQGHDARQDPLGFFEHVRKLIRGRKSKRKDEVAFDPAILEDRDLRKLVAEAAGRGLTPLEAIRGAGLTGIWPEA